MKKEFKEFINNFKNTAKYFKLQKNIIFFYLFISLIIGIIGIIIPILTSKLLINITEGNLNSLLTIAFVIFVTKITSKTLQSIYSLTSKKLEIKTVAEGIETKEQVEYLKQIGCDIVQGYYFEKPITIKEFEKKYLKLPKGTEDFNNNSNK